MNSLQHSWHRAWSAVGAKVSDDVLLERLLACYEQPHRKYHTLEHLAECVSKFDQALGLAVRPGEVEVALWFHDAIYDVKRQDNELQSAIWARDALLAGGAAREAAERVCGLVMSTRHDALPASPDGQLLVDVDLSILGAPAERFQEYEAQVRQEYAYVPDHLFRGKRREILCEFLARPAIYSTAYFRDILEAPARENLRRSVSQLGG